MRLVIDWEPVGVFCFEEVSLFVGALQAMGATSEHGKYFVNGDLSFDGRIVATVKEKSNIIDDGGWTDYFYQLYIDDVFLETHGLKLLEKAIPIFAQEDFELEYPESAWPSDPRDQTVQRFLQRAELSLREMLKLQK